MVLPSEGTYLSSFRYAARPDPAPQDVDRFLTDWIARLVDPNQPPHFKLGRTTDRGNPSIRFCHRALSWQRKLRQARPMHVDFGLLLALVAAYKDVTAAHTTPRMWVEKTPLNEQHVGRLRRFPYSRYIQLVRDPAATLASLRAAHSAAGRSHFEAATHVRTIGRSFRLAARHARELRGRYLVVRYEDLIRNTAGEMARVREFLGIADDPALVIPTSGRVAVESNSSFSPAAPGVVTRGAMAATMLPADDQIITAFVGPLAQAWGYEVSRLSRGARLAIRLRHIPTNLVAGARRILGGWSHLGY
jgi:hypothetical protein